MGNISPIVESLAEALNNLYDPGYEPHPALQRALHVATHEAMRARLMRLITDLAPDPRCPEDAPTRRYHCILRHRFVDGWTLAHTAEELGISVRHLSRQQKEAIAWLASRLEGAPEPEGQPWMAEVRRELDAVMEETPGAVTDLKDVLGRVRQVADPLAAARQVDLTVKDAPYNLLVASPATFVEQAILVTFDRMTADEPAPAPPAHATIEAEQASDNQVKVRITLSPPRTEQEPNDYLVDELLGRQEGTRAWRVSEHEAVCELCLPAMRPVTVLLIEDNQDLYYVYRRYTRGTPYRIVHMTDPADLWETVQSAQPGIIVLDIMLPDGDGWQILTHLHQRPETRRIPIVVCTVVRAQELAKALGAAAYLAKPIQRDNFIAALDRVRPRPTAHT